MRAVVRAYFAPKTEIPAQLRLTLGITVALAVLAGWCVATYGGLLPSVFLPPPHAVLVAAYDYMLSGALPLHIWASVLVIFSGFALASLLAVPLGILMGSFQVVAAVVEPVVNFMRYLPVTALIPLLILWIGIGIEEKIAVIFLGTFFQQVVLIADVSAGVSKDLVNSSYTLGASRRQVVTRVLVPAAMPGVLDTLRVTMGWAWTYLVVAELVAANAGLGYMIMQAMRGMRPEVIFMGILVIGLLGLLTDQLFKYIRRALVPWASVR